MSTHSYSRCWLHLIWETLRREPMLDKRAAAKASVNLSEYALEKRHLHEDQLLQCRSHSYPDRPADKFIDKQAIELLKGSSSHWINQHRLIKGRFSWGRGYGAFSVSHSDVGRVAKYIANQEEHHRKRSFEDEYQLFVKKDGLEWRDEENR